MEGGTNSSKSGGRGKGLVKDEVGHDRPSQLLWKPCVVSEFLMELWKMSFSHLKLLYLMCLTLDQPCLLPVSSLPWALRLVVAKEPSAVNLELGIWFSPTVVPGALTGLNTLFFSVCRQF